MTVRKTFCALAAALAIGSVGCGRPSPASRSAKQYDSNQVLAQSVFGSSSVSIAPNLCAGRATLQQGSATVADACFTGDTNVVLCTDTTGLNPVRCAPGRGALAISGTGSDVISYARVK